MPIPRKKFELSPSLRLGVGRGHPNKLLKIASAICLLVAFALTANAIRLVFQTGASAQDKNTPQVLGASDVKSTADQPSQPQIVEYTVQKGDTLFNISQKFNISWTTLATLNNLKSPFALKPGQTLQIPH